MAKYRYLNTGEIFDCEKAAFDFYCDEFNIDYCMSPDDSIDMFIRNYKEYGFELIKFRLAEILGVEEDQEWIATNEEEKIFRIHNGARQWKLKDETSWRDCGSERRLAELINNPNLIQSVPNIPKWTEREIEIARAWKTLNPDMKQFEITTESSNAPEEFEIDGVPLSNLNNDCPNFTAQDFLEVKVCDILGDEV